jgi:transitional endoplasmic reticulum ATPase
MDELNVETGDVLEIKGKRRTIAKCLPLYRDDEGKGIIRIDELGRNNIGVASGNAISITKSSTVIAQKVTVSLLEKHGMKPNTGTEPRTPADEKYLTSALELTPFIKGDSVMIPYYGGSMRYRVVDVTPNTNVEVGKDTVFTIIEEPENNQG